jgi:flavin-dependent dehydrogenase
MASGPFAAWSGRVAADGAALVGDAADFFDPFTGEGIYSALRGAELLAAVVLRTAEGTRPITARQLAAYRGARPSPASGRSSGW